jgi:hypothetical protein
LSAVRATEPFMTVARDVENYRHLPKILDQAAELARFADYVIVVPKDTRMAEKLADVIPPQYLLGYSVPSRYGATSLPATAFGSRPVHLLGGRPDIQRQFAKVLNVVSIDGNRFTLDARYGDFFDGERFRPHPKGGYRRCLKDSIINIEMLWKSYKVAEPLEVKYDQNRRGTADGFSRPNVRSDV